MDNGTPALSDRAFPRECGCLCQPSVVLMLVDGKMQIWKHSESIASYVIRPGSGDGGTVDASRPAENSSRRSVHLTENEQLKKKNAQLSFDLLEFNRLKAENAQLQSMAGVRSSVHISSPWSA